MKKKTTTMTKRKKEVVGDKKRMKNTPTEEEILDQTEDDTLLLSLDSFDDHHDSKGRSLQSSTTKSNDDEDDEEEDSDPEDTVLTKRRHQRLLASVRETTIQDVKSDLLKQNQDSLTLFTPLISSENNKSNEDEEEDEKKERKKKKKNQQEKHERLTLQDLMSSKRKKSKDTEEEQEDLMVQSKPSKKKKKKDIIKTFDEKKQKKVLNKPLNDGEHQMISRKVYFNQVKEQVTNKWQEIVNYNKTADHLVFPLKRSNLKTGNESHEEVLQDIVKHSNDEQIHESLKTPLENKMDQLLSLSSNNLQDNKELTEKEEELLLRISKEEAKQRLSELQKTRALLSFQQQKLKRESRIKSRGFRKIKKREKSKNVLKDFESLKESNPEEALKKIQELNLERIKERVTLRHKLNKNLLKRAFLKSSSDKIFNFEELQTNLEKSMTLGQSLRQKIDQFHSDEEEISKEDEEEEEEEMNEEENQEEDMIMEGKIPSNFNPWLKQLKTVNGSQEEEEEEEESGPKIIVLRNSFKKSLHETNKDEEEEEKKHQLMKEAFAEDEVIEDFVKEQEKKEEEEAETDKLPGWGLKWIGAGSELGDEKRKKRRRRMKREDNKKNTSTSSKKNQRVIINSNSSSSALSSLKVKRLPFPFVSVPDFESGLLNSTPIGRDFVPETSFKILTKERISTKTGKIIDPMI